MDHDAAASTTRHRRAGRPRATNLALLGLSATAFVTGWLGFAAGTIGPGTALVTAHGVSGLTLLVLARPKTPVVRRGWRRGGPGRGFGLALSLAAVVTVVTGIGHTFGWRSAGPVTVMQLHVGGGVMLVVALVAHVVRHPVRPRRGDLSRRNALRAGGVLGVGGLLVLALQATGAAGDTRRGRRRFTGSHEVGSHDPSSMPVTQWFLDDVPDLDPRTWRLRLTDRDGSRELSLAALTDHHAARDLVATLDCTGGWYAEQRWSGVPLRALVEPGPAHRSVLITSVTGFRRRLPIAALPELLLATGYAGRPLRGGHGAPARLVAPGRRGVWWVKWVASIELSTRPDWATLPLPAR